MEDGAWVTRAISGAEWESVRSLTARVMLALIVERPNRWDRARAGGTGCRGPGPPTHTGLGAPRVGGAIPAEAAVRRDGGSVFAHVPEPGVLAGDLHDTYPVQVEAAAVRRLEPHERSRAERACRDDLMLPGCAGEEINRAA